MPKVKLNTSPAACIGDNIRVMLTLRGFSRKQFCARMNISEAQLCNYIKGRTIVPTEQIFRAAEILKIEPAELVRNKKEFGKNCLRFLA